MVYKERSIVAVSLATLVALGACTTGEVLDDNVVVTEFAGATATSVVSDAGISTELHGADGSLLATAEWNVSARSAVVTVGEQTHGIQLEADARFDGQVANDYVHASWQHRDADAETPYDGCYIDYYLCETCISCSVCGWIGEPEFPIYHCEVVGNGCESNGMCLRAL